MKVKLMSALMGIAVLMGLMAGVSNASSVGWDTEWKQTDTNDFLVTKLYNLGAGYSFYIYDVDSYDAGNFDTYELLLGAGTTKKSRTIYVGYDTNSGEYWIRDAVSAAYLVNLGDSPYFGFFFTAGSSTPIETYTMSLDEGVYYLSVADAMEVQLSDATPIPLPPTAILFGTGLMGILSFGLRRQRGA